MGAVVIAAVLALPFTRLLRGSVERLRHPSLPDSRIIEPGVQLAALLVPISAAAAGIRGFEFWLSCLLGWPLLLLAWIDMRHFLLPDVLTLPLIVLGLGSAWFVDASYLTDRAAGAALGYVSLTCVAALYRYVRRRDGLGAGDAKLLAAGGAWVGASAVPLVLLAGALLGIVWACTRTLRWRRTSLETALPFGPFLAAAIWFAWL